jgi:hypothetical protein
MSLTAFTVVVVNIVQLSPRFRQALTAGDEGLICCQTPMTEMATIRFLKKSRFTRSLLIKNLAAS